MSGEKHVTEKVLDYVTAFEAEHGTDLEPAELRRLIALAWLDGRLDGIASCQAVIA